jgi:hypothetical protein
MSDLEELKKRKEQLLLENEIAKLERSKELNKRVSKFRWFWVVPVAIVGSLFFFGAIDEEEPILAILGALAFIPLLLKVFVKKY